MIIREDAAKTKWCPFSRRPVVFDKTLGGKLIDASAVQANRNQDDTPSTACLGSKCMAWRWHQEDIKLGFCGLTSHAAITDSH